MNPAISYLDDIVALMLRFLYLLVKSGLNCTRLSKHILIIHYCISLSVEKTLLNKRFLKCSFYWACMQEKSASFGHIELWDAIVYETFGLKTMRIWEMTFASICANKYNCSLAFTAWDFSCGCCFANYFRYPSPIFSVRCFWSYHFEIFLFLESW